MRLWRCGAFTPDHTWCASSKDGANGDVVKSCDLVLGYLHRGDEKIAENMTYNPVPYTDRLDYGSASQQRRLRDGC